MEDPNNVMLLIRKLLQEEQQQADQQQQNQLPDISPQRSEASTILNNYFAEHPNRISSSYIGDNFGIHLPSNSASSPLDLTPTSSQNLLDLGVLSSQADPLSSNLSNFHQSLLIPSTADHSQSDTLNAFELRSSFGFNSTNNASSSGSNGGDLLADLIQPTSSNPLSSVSSKIPSSLVDSLLSSTPQFGSFSIGGTPVSGVSSQILGRQVLSQSSLSPVTGLGNGGSDGNEHLAKFESQIRKVANEIYSTMHFHLNGLQLRKEQLLQQLQHIKTTYASIIHQRQRNGGEIGDLLPQISFTRPDPALYRAITSLGFITTPAFAPNCNAAGDGLEVAVAGVATCFSVTTRNCFNEELLLGSEQLQINIIGIDDNGHRLSIPHSVVDHQNGKYTISYTSPSRIEMCRQVRITVNINGLPINGSPFNVNVQEEQARPSWKHLIAYGTEGAQPGQFCRPWGVALIKLPSNAKHSGVQNVAQNGAKEYLMAVADRSNNRIQLVKITLESNTGEPVMNVIKIFGSGPGNRPGQFDRPAGIAINATLGHIIVADKDNHRVQVFDMTGGYQFKFGEKGSRVGQFCYPWDIDSCPSSQQIVVSDTRNRRVQLFTPYGQYLSHISQPLDSPRGVAFMGDKIVISDFNKHRLLILEKSSAVANVGQTQNSKPDDAAFAKYVGFGEGAGWGEFLRPQGVTIGGSGAAVVYCSDSRNNRICCWNSVTQGFEYLTEEVMQLDRPSGIAVAENILAVIDFGNNRVQICRRS